MAHTMEKVAAAAAIGYSPKHVERLVAEGKLTQVYGQVGGRGPRRALYDPAEVARIASAGRLAPPVVLLAADRTPSSNGNGHVQQNAVHGAELERRPPADQVLARFADLVLTLSETLTRMSATTSTYVAMPEAARLLGVTEACARRIVKQKQLETVRDREGVKVLRAALVHNGGRPQT